MSKQDSKIDFVHVRNIKKYISEDMGERVLDCMEKGNKVDVKLLTLTKTYSFYELLVKELDILARDDYPAVAMFDATLKDYKDLNLIDRVIIYYLYLEQKGAGFSQTLKDRAGDCINFSGKDKEFYINTAETIKDKISLFKKRKGK